MALTGLVLVDKSAFVRGTTAVDGELCLSEFRDLRVPLPDLLIAACAQQHGADVLHVDRHFDVLAEVLAFTAIRAG